MPGFTASEGNYSAFEENEVSLNAAGGTEIAKRMLGSRINPELQHHFQIVSSRVRELDPTKIRVYWAHDLPGDPECNFLSDHNARNSFHKIVFGSDWQYQAFRAIRSLPWSRNSIVIPSGIEPSPVSIDEKFEDDTINLYYASTPHRGLEITIAVFERLAGQYPELRLHVHSSFKLYGWEDRDAQFEPLYERCRKHPSVTYHGHTSHQDLLEAIKKYHILAYPCVWQETSCRVLIEAMSALCLPVHSNLAALPETSGGLTMMYDGDQDPSEHASEFHAAMVTAIEHIRLMKKGDSENLKRRLLFNKSYSDTRFGIDVVQKQWEAALNNLLQVYPTPESRKPPEKTFVYDSTRYQG